MQLIPLLDASAQFLEDLASGKCTDLIRSMGLCTNLSVALMPRFGIREKHYMMDLMKHYFRKNNMDENYPIEGGSDAYNAQMDKYDLSTEFGKARMQLAIDLARYFRSESKALFAILQEFQTAKGDLRLDELSLVSGGWLNEDSE